MHCMFRALAYQLTATHVPPALCTQKASVIGDKSSWGSSKRRGLLSPRETRGPSTQTNKTPADTYVSQECRLYLSRSVGQTPHMVPSPSSKRKSSRRLPSYLRGIGAEPVGELRRLREEAAQAAQDRKRQREEPAQPPQAKEEPTADADGRERKRRRQAQNSAGRRDQQTERGVRAPQSIEEVPSESSRPAVSAPEHATLAPKLERPISHALSHAHGEASRPAVSAPEHSTLAPNRERLISHAGMWTCPLVFCDFEKFAQKCLFALQLQIFLA